MAKARLFQSLGEMAVRDERIKKTRKRLHDEIKYKDKIIEELNEEVEYLERKLAVLKENQWKWRKETLAEVSTGEVGDRAIENEVNQILENNKNWWWNLRHQD